MMLLARFWYVVLAILAGFAVYLVLLAVGEYNRRSNFATNEALAADSQVVKWALERDSRLRLDALLVGSIDKGIQDSLIACIDKDKIPQKSKDDARKAIGAVNDKIPPSLRPDALFVVDREGRMVAEIGYDKAAAFDDFEMGGYPAVNDALHGYLRDDTWVWGGQIYRVVTRPVEYDVQQPPAGAIIGLRAVDKKFTQDLAELTRTNIAFYTSTGRAASGTQQGFEEGQLEQIIGELPKLDTDPLYSKGGRSDLRSLSNGSLGAIFTKFDGEAYDAGAGFAVVRARVTLSGPIAFLSQADDKDKSAVSLTLVIAVVLVGILVGLGLSILEHELPLWGMARETTRLRKGEIDLFQLPPLRGRYRAIANEINAGIERVAEKGGGAPRKQADLESILGPAPAQPAMSAFAFPGPDPGAAVNIPQVPPAYAMPPTPHQAKPPVPQNRPPPPSNPGPAQRGSSSGGFPAGPSNSANVMPRISEVNQGLQQPATLPQLQQPVTMPTTVQQVPLIPQKMPSGATPAAQPQAPAPRPPAASQDEDEQTTVAAIPREIMDQATGAGQNRAVVDNEQAAWQAVFEEFVKTKKQCNEPVEGLTFGKFSQTLQKNRDALVQRHACKRVKFTVYVKDGRASLKATPVKD